MRGGCDDPSHEANPEMDMRRIPRRSGAVSGRPVRRRASELSGGGVMILITNNKTGAFTHGRDMAHAYRIAQIKGWTDYSMGADDGQTEPVMVTPKRGRIMAAMNVVDDAPLPEPPDEVTL